MATTTPPRLRGNTPWGSAQTCKELLPGIWFVSTASHGGMWLTPEREAKIPAHHRKAARQYAPEQWYEEDCDVCAVANAFADEFNAIGDQEFVKHAKAYIAADKRYRDPNAITAALADAANQHHADAHAPDIVTFADQFAEFTPADGISRD